MHQGAQGRGQGGQGQYRAYGPIVFHTAIFSFRNLRSRLRIQFQWKWLSLGLQIKFQWKCRANCQLKKFKSRHPHEADPLAHDVNISSLPSPESEPPSYDAITARMSSFAADDDAEEVSRLPFTVNQVGRLNSFDNKLYDCWNKPSNFFWHHRPNLGVLRHGLLLSDPSNTLRK